MFWIQLDQMLQKNIPTNYNRYLVYSLPENSIIITLCTGNIATWYPTRLEMQRNSIRSDSSTSFYLDIYSIDTHTVTQVKTYSIWIQHICSYIVWVQYAEGEWKGTAISYSKSYYNQRVINLSKIIIYNYFILLQSNLTRNIAAMERFGSNL